MKLIDMHVVDDEDHKNPLFILEFEDTFVATECPINASVDETIEVLTTFLGKVKDILEHPDRKSCVVH